MLEMEKQKQKNGEIEKWRNREMEKWRNGEMEIEIEKPEVNK